MFCVSRLEEDFKSSCVMDLFMGRRVTQHATQKIQHALNPGSRRVCAVSRLGRDTATSTPRVLSLTDSLTLVKIYVDNIVKTLLSPPYVFHVSFGRLRVGVMLLPRLPIDAREEVSGTATGRRTGTHRPSWSKRSTCTPVLGLPYGVIPSPGGAGARCCFGSVEILPTNGTTS